MHLSIIESESRHHVDTTHDGGFFFLGQNESKDLHAEGDIGLEDRALVAAFHHCLFPQLTGDKLKLVSSVTAMLWPSVTLPVHTTLLENQRGII